MYFKNDEKQSLKDALIRLDEYEGASATDIEANLSRFTWEKSAVCLWEALKL